MVVESPVTSHERRLHLERLFVLGCNGFESSFTHEFPTLHLESARI
jgi:hypothetical protein